MEKGLGICQVCNESPAMWIDSRKPFGSWKVCEVCVAIDVKNKDTDNGNTKIVILEE